jgi:hypothetical protein
LGLFRFVSFSFIPLAPLLLLLADLAGASTVVLVVVACKYARTGTLFIHVCSVRYELPEPERKKGKGRKEEERKSQAITY